MSRARPLWIGLTGGIASGKSAVAAEFARLGVPIIDGDELARAVVEPGQPALAAIINRFGNSVVTANGRLDRRQMRERIFNNPAEKQALEAILHPVIRAEQQASASRLGDVYQIHVMPLLIETHSQSLYDRILVVDCSGETQLARLLNRDGINHELAQRMLAAQTERAVRLQSADDVLDNNGPVTELPEKVAVLHQRYLQLAAAVQRPAD
jgi:dephospho-CoA kinase